MRMATSPKKPRSSWGQGTGPPAAGQGPASTGAPARQVVETPWHGLHGLLTPRFQREALFAGLVLPGFERIKTSAALLSHRAAFPHGPEDKGLVRHTRRVASLPLSLAQLAGVGLLLRSAVPQVHGALTDMGHIPLAEGPLGPWAPKQEGAWDPDLLRVCDRA